MHLVEQLADAGQPVDAAGFTVEQEDLGRAVAKNLGQRKAQMSELGRAERAAVDGLEIAPAASKWQSDEEGMISG